MSDNATRYQYTNCNTVSVADLMPATRARIETLVTDCTTKACVFWTPGHRKHRPVARLTPEAPQQYTTVARAIGAYHLGGAMPPNLVAAHHCDHEWCVNPKHIEPMRQQENILDCHRKGRDWASRSGQRIRDLPK